MAISSQTTQNQPRGADAIYKTSNTQTLKVIISRVHDTTILIPLAIIL